MTTLSSIANNHLVLNCRCGHVGQIAVSDLIEVHGGDVSVDAIERAARCRRCGTKASPACKSLISGLVGPRRITAARMSRSVRECPMKAGLSIAFLRVLRKRLCDRFT